MHRSLAGGRTESIRTSTTAMLPREPDTSQTLLGHFPDVSRTLPKHVREQAELLRRRRTRWLRRSPRALRC